MSCSTSEKRNIHKEYNDLVKQQVLAHEGKDQDFNKLISEFSHIHPKLVLILDKYFQVNESKKIKTAFENLKVNNKKIHNTDHGTPVFHKFHGHWNGIWSQFDTHNHYDHDWFPPEKIKTLVFQKVIIGEWNKRLNMRINEVPAINTYNIKTGLVLGGVDYDKNSNKTHAPHLGFYVDEHTLIWLARFTNKKISYYSLYFEKIEDNKSNKEYKIRGIGFYWDSKLKKIIQPHYKSGNYQQVL